MKKLCLLMAMVLTLCALTVTPLSANEDNDHQYSTTIQIKETQGLVEMTGGFSFSGYNQGSFRSIEHYTKPYLVTYLMDIPEEHELRLDDWYSDVYWLSPTALKYTVYQPVFLIIKGKVSKETKNALRKARIYETYVDEKRNEVQFAGTSKFIGVIHLYSPQGE